MFGKKPPEVLVVGAGPVGLMTALVLAKQGVDVQIVDKEWRTGAHSYALALHARSIELLKELGVTADIPAMSYPVRTVGLYDESTRRAEVPLETENKEPLPAYVLRQDVFEGLLEDALRAEGVRVHWNHEASQLQTRENEAAVTIDKMEKDVVGYATTHTEWVVAQSADVCCPVVIAADGHRSLMRRGLGIEFAESGTPLHFAVFEFQTDADLDNEMRVALGENATDVVWPLPNGYCRWSFQLTDAAAPESSRVKDRHAIQIGRSKFPVLTAENLQRLVAERAPWFQGSIGEIRWRLMVRFESRLADRFGEGRVWLAGDAGHMTSPVGMQSMNVGLREAKDLGDTVAGILRQKQPWDGLQTYNTNRISEWRFLLGVNSSLEAAADADPWVAQRAHRLLGCLPASGDDLKTMARQLGLQV